MLRASVCSYASCTPASLHTPCAMVPAICLRSVSRVMGILRADPFYPLCIPLRAIYSDVLCALMCPCELFVPVLCMCPVFDSCAPSVSLYTWYSFVRSVHCVLLIRCDVRVLCLFSCAVQFYVLCLVCSRVLPCSVLFRVLNYSEYLFLWYLSVSSTVSISECSMYLCVLYTYE
jgi:hypothetical protein